MKRISLPAIKGRFGNWVYFQTTIKVKDLMPNRVITVPESDELYSNNLNEILQREYNTKRLDLIEDYLLRIEDRFFSSLIVAIHKGEPKWSDIEIGDVFDEADDETIERINSKVGILSLAGNEEMFVLDGQHRLLGLRRAYQQNPNKIGEDEISLVLVLHKSKERTRRLFTVLNRYAVRIKPAEEIILEEDDAAAIISRRLVQNHPVFALANAISKSYKGAKSAAKELRTTRAFSMPASDLSSFTTLVCVYKISQEVIDHRKIQPAKKAIKRPTDEVLEKLYDKVVEFWDFFFEVFPWVVEFIKGKTIHDEMGRLQNRNKQTGGNILLRPEGQTYMGEIYKRFLDNGQLPDLKDKVQELELHLSADIWRHVFWEGKMLSKNKPLKREIFKYMLGEEVNRKEMETKLHKIYDDLGTNFPGLDELLN